MKKELKIFIYNAKGEYVSHQFTEAEEGTPIYAEINKQPRKLWNQFSGILEFRYVTDNLNTEKDYAAEKWIKEKHRIYFYVLDPDKQCVELEFTKNLDNFIDRILISRKLRKHRCLHYFENRDNDVFDFGKMSPNFNKIYYITDVLDDEAAKAAIYGDIEEQANAVKNELSFLERMLEITKSDVITNKAVVEDRLDVAPHKDDEMECPKCRKYFNKRDNIHNYTFYKNEYTFCCPECKAVVDDDHLVEIIPNKSTSFIKKLLKINTNKPS